jgi:cysteinyl-tRNA synthetase
MFEIGNILGLFASGKAQFLLEQQSLKAAKSGLSDAEIYDLVTAREQARKSRDYQTADQIRDDLIAQDVMLEDSSGGTSWHRR